MSWAILTDITKCIGCAECVKACKVVNDLPQDKPREWQKNDGLSASNWTSVLHDGTYNVRKQCRHCIEPACENVCPVGALHKTEDGAVVYDKEKCLGCRYCMMACPYGIPRYDWDKPTPYIKKCIMCYDNIKSGKLDEPGCTGACPTGATVFGKREDLLREANKRIAGEPDKYLNHIYGEHEVGGTNVLYITSKGCPLDFLYYFENRFGQDKSLMGAPAPTEPMPGTTKWAMSAVPFAFVGMGGIMGAIYWTINRRRKLNGAPPIDEDGGHNENKEEAVENGKD